MRITEFFNEKNPGVKEHYNYVLQLIDELKLTSTNGDLVMFGGFVRDIIAGINIEELKTKDVDLYFLYHDNVDKSVKTQLLRKKVDFLLNNKQVKVNRYNKSCSKNKYFKNAHGMIDFEYKGVSFDISFECDSGRFDKNLDFLCNQLYINIIDGTIRCRKYNKPLINDELLSIDKCISDITNRRLTSLLTIVKQESLKYKYVRHLNRRRAKMESYGYKSNTVDKEIMSKIYLSYINSMMANFREQMDELTLTLSNKDRQQRKLLKLYKHHKNLSEINNIKDTIADLDDSIKIYQANILCLTDRIAKAGRNSAMY